MRSFFLTLRIGSYLAVRQIRRASRWTTVLIIFVMMLTFLNLVVVTGLLVGIVDGISAMYKQEQTGDLFVSTLDNKNYIDHSTQILNFIERLPQVEHVAARYVSLGYAEANYKTRTDFNDKPNISAANILGIDPLQEDAFSQISGLVKEGHYLSEGDWDQVLIGSQLIDRYAFGGDQPGILPESLKNVYPGSKVRVTVNGTTREMTVKGILVTPANSPLAAGIFMPADEMRMLLGRDDFNLNQIGVRLTPGADPNAFVSLLTRSGIAEFAKVQPFVDTIPSGVLEVRSTFTEVGNIISSLGLVVAAIVIFIVIYINAVTRRKYIGILKGIGITGGAIEAAYMMQSVFYALLGSGIGLLFLYGFLVPYVEVHPIVLPISNAFIEAPLNATLWRVALLCAATIVAGYIPARMIIRKNTLDSILGR